MPAENHILIYRLGSLGDTIMALPCFHLVRKIYPGARIAILTNQPVSGKAAPALSVLENSGLCNEAIGYPVGTRNRQVLAELRQKIRQFQPRTVINLAADRGWLKSLRDHLFFRSCGVKKIVGTPWSQGNLHIQQMSRGDCLPESARLAFRLASLGSLDLADRSVWDLRLTPEECTQASEFLPSTHQAMIAVSLGTKHLVNEWGEENWKILVRRLSHELPGTNLILIGSGDEWERSKTLGDAWRGTHINLCGKTSPRISAAILKRCHLFIGHDSGPMHLASAEGIPTLGLFSWFNPPGQWFPGHRSWKFVRVLYPKLPEGGWKSDLRTKRGASEGIGLLQPNDVFKSAMELWRDYSNSGASSFSGGQVKATH